MDLSGKLWIANDFAGAEALTRRVIEDGSYLAEPARKQLALILAGLPPEAALDEGDHVTPPVPLDARALSIAYSEQIEGVHCCMIEAEWNPEFSRTSELAVGLNDGGPVSGQGDHQASLRILETSRQAAPTLRHIGIASRYLIASDLGLEFIRPYLPFDARIIPFVLEGYGGFNAISLVQTDCLVEATSCVTKTRKGRLRIARGMFKESEIVERPIIQHIESWEIFVSPKLSKAFVRGAREGGIKGIRLLDDITRR